MFAIIGSTTLLICLILSLYSTVASTLGLIRKSPQLIESGRYATYVIPLILLTSIITLISAFLTHDFSLKYVAGHSNSLMDPSLVWVAFYAGNEGSLLFIAFALSVVSAIAIWLASRQINSSQILPYTIVVMMTIIAFFLLIIYLLANPFDTLDFVPQDGQGINPLLTHFGMFIHPPVMMTGLVLVTIPYAFAMGSLLSGRTNDEWVDQGRLWGLISFITLGSGLLLGAWWAYTILGWGGYWGWDPIENVGLMPWLVLTAFIHSIMVQKRRGMFRMWNIVLISIAFNLAALGMFFNRAGPVPSVHSFGESTIGWAFLLFFTASIVFSLSLFLKRLPQLKNSRNLESMLSREAAFLINNFLLLAIAFIILWGIMFPLVSQFIQGVTITVGAPFYNQTTGPLMLFIIFVMGIGPLLPWRHADVSRIKRALLIPLSTSCITVLFLLIIGVRSPYPIIAFTLCMFVVTGILREWITGTLKQRSRGGNYVIAFIRLILSNRPRYGGYISHIAILLLALGVTGSSFYSNQLDTILKPGEEATISKYTVKYISSNFESKGDRIERTVTLEASKNGRIVGYLTAQNHFYPSFRISSTRSAIRSTPIDDLYIIPQEFFEDNRVAFRIMVNPLVWWIWIAGPILLVGTLIAVWPSRRHEIDDYAPITTTEFGQHMSSTTDTTPS